MLIADPPESLDELGGSWDELAFSLQRLEDDRSDVLRRDMGHEQTLERAERGLRIEPRYGFGNGAR